MHYAIRLTDHHLLSFSFPCKELILIVAAAALLSQHSDPQQHHQNSRAGKAPGRWVDRRYGMLCEFACPHSQVLRLLAPKGQGAR